MNDTVTIAAPASTPVDVPAPAQVRDLGRQPYEPVWRAMQAFTDARGPQTPDELWLVELNVMPALGGDHFLAPRRKLGQLGLHLLPGLLGQLLVVSRKPPDSSFLRPSYSITTPYPPGPGFPRQAPSV